MDKVHEELTEDQIAARIDYLADRIKAEFINVKSTLYKRPNLQVAATDANRKSFLKAAEFCFLLDADPRTFVTSLLQLPYPAELIQPHLLCRENTVGTYLEYVSVKTLTPEEYFDVNSEYLKIQIEEFNRSVEEILLDDRIAMRPWFRICITKEPVFSVISKYKNQVTFRTPEEKKEVYALLKKKNLDTRRLE